MVKNIHHNTVDIGLKSCYQTDTEFNNKIKCFMALAFLPDGFVELTDDDLPQEFVSYFETHYIGGDRSQGPRRRRMQPNFNIELWNAFERTQNKISRTNGIEGFHNPIQNSITKLLTCIQISNNS